MKKSGFILVLFLLPIFAMPQDFITASYNSTASGRNISIGYAKYLASGNEFGGALRINISKITQADDQSTIYYKRLFATDWIHYFGLQLYYHRYFFERWNCIKPYLLYDFQMSYSTTRSSMFSPYAYDVNGDVLYKNFIEYFGPFLWLEQSIGIGFKAKIFKSLYLFENLGATIQYIYGEEEQILFRGNFDWEFGYLISAGLAYEL